MFCRICALLRLGEQERKEEATMFPPRNLDLGGRSMRETTPVVVDLDQQLQQQQQKTQQQFQKTQQHKYHEAKQSDTEASSSSCDNGSEDSVLNFRKLSLSDNASSAAGSSIPIQNRLAAAAASYLPQYLDNYSGFRTAANRFPQEFGYDRCPVYYPPPMSPSPYLSEQPILGGMHTSPGIFTSPTDGLNNSGFNLALFARNNLQPPYVGPTNVPTNLTSHYPGISGYYPGISATAYPSMTSVHMEDYFLRNSYTSMTDSILSRRLSSFLKEITYRNENKDSRSRGFEEDFIDRFIRAITISQESLVMAACNPHGTYVIQNLIKLARKRPLIALIPRGLADYTVFLMTKVPGMHVVKQCFVKLGSEKSMDLFCKMMDNDNWLAIAKDETGTGCRGLNECLHYMVDTCKNYLLSRICLYAGDLAMHLFGTYVVQYAVDLRTDHTGVIVKNILPMLKNLITVKNGSHLVEKCLETEHGAVIVQEILNHGNNRIVRYAVDECGNYVIQKAIVYTRDYSPQLHQRLVKILSNERSAILVNRHGKHVIKKMDEAGNVYQNYQN